MPKRIFTLAMDSLFPFPIWDLFICQDNEINISIMMRKAQSEGIQYASYVIFKINKKRKAGDVAH